jgi:hypothetical protein
MKISMLVSGPRARKITVEKEQILALDSISQSVTRIYMKGGIVRDVEGNLKTIKDLCRA